MCIVLQWESYLPWLYRMLINQHKHREGGDSRCLTMVPDRGFSKLYVALEGETVGRLCRAAGIYLPPRVQFCDTT